MWRFTHNVSYTRVYEIKIATLSGVTLYHAIGFHWESEGAISIVGEVYLSLSSMTKTLMHM